MATVSAAPDPIRKSHLKANLIIVASILALAVLVLGIDFVTQTTRNDHIVKNGVKTTGTPTGELVAVTTGRSRGSSGDRSYYVEYRFSANGQQYTAKGTNSYNDTFDAKRAIGYNDEIEIYYLADDPKQSYADDVAAP